MHSLKAIFLASAAASFLLATAHAGLARRYLGEHRAEQRAHDQALTDPGHQRRMRGLLDLGLDDGTSSWWLNPDGYWTRHSRDEAGNPLRDIQETLVRERRVRSAEESGLASER